jgi:hypothetical protein
MADPPLRRGSDGDSRRIPGPEAQPSALPDDTGNGLALLDEQIASLLENLSVGTATGGRRASLPTGRAIAATRAAPAAARPLRRPGRAQPAGADWRPALKKTARYGLLVVIVTLVGIAIGVLSVYVTLYLSVGAL